MIQAFFGFKKYPFAKDIDSKKIFSSQSMKELFARFEYMKQTRGLMLLTGQPGAGKTLAIRTFIEDLNPNLYYPVHIPLSTVSHMEFYRQLCVRLTGEAFFRKSVCFDKIQRAIIELVNDQKKVPVVVIDEAQMLKAENLFEIPIILNFQIDSVDPLLFIMVGQTYLRDIIARPVHKSLNQRFSLKYALQSLDKQETKDYITHQLALAGCRKPILSDAAIETIFLNTSGNPRDIGNLTLKVLTLAAKEKLQTITEEEIYRASKEL